MRMLKSWKFLTLGLLIAAAGCDPSEQGLDPNGATREDPGMLAPLAPDSIQVSEQGLATQTFTMSWAQKLPNKNCNFGDTTLGNQAARNSYASGRMAETRTISGMCRRRIVSMKLKTPAPSSFTYDDVLLLTLNNTVVMTSDNRAAGYLAGTSVGSIGTKPVDYVWSRLLNKLINNENKQPAWCASGASTCTVPVTQTSGIIDVQIPNFEAVDLAAYPKASDTRTFKLVTVGDNDDGTYNSGIQTQDRDCTHTAVNLDFTVTTELTPLDCTDPLLGDWYSEGYLAQIYADGYGKMPVAGGACPAGLVIFENIVKTGCTSATQCSYTATRYSDSTATVCPLRTLAVTIQVNGNSMVEYLDGAVLRSWTR